MMSNNSIDDPEIVAISDVFNSLKGLEASAQSRVINYVSQKLGLSCPVASTQRDYVPDASTDTNHSTTAYQQEDGSDSSDVEGISPVAKKWIIRNSLDLKSLMHIFSLGIEDIDIVAKKVPGGNKKEKMRNVFLLRGIAAYLSTGTSKFTQEQVKEACLHYDAFDTANFASYLRSFTADVSGTKETGYTLTARGLSSAAELIQSMSAGTT